MKVFIGKDVSLNHEFKIDLSPMGKGDYAIVAEFFLVHPPWVTLLTLINVGVKSLVNSPKDYRCWDW